MGPRYLQGQIHADYSTEESVWSDYRSQIKNLYDASVSKADFNNHLIREYNRKINILNQSTDLYISPFNAEFIIILLSRRYLRFSDDLNFANKFAKSLYLIIEDEI